MPDSAYEPDLDPSAPEPAPARASWKWWAAAAGVVAVVGVGVALTRSDDRASDDYSGVVLETVGGAEAVVDGSGGFASGDTGTIATLNGTTIVLEPLGQSSSETVTVVVTDDTLVVETADGDLADLATGDLVVVLGEADAGGAISATSLSEGEGLPGRSGGVPAEAEPPTVGTIAGVDGSTLTINREGTEITVEVDEETLITVTNELALEDLAEGDEIRVGGELDGETFTATTIRRRGDTPVGGQGDPPAPSD